MALPFNLNLTALDPIERLTELCTKADIRYEESSIQFANGTIFIINLFYRRVLNGYSASVTLAARSYFVSIEQWGKANPKAIVSALILDELGLAPPEDPPESPRSTKRDVSPSCSPTRVSEVARSTMSELLANYGNPNYVPDQSKIFSLVRQMGKITLNSLASMESQMHSRRDSSE